MRSSHNENESKNTSTFTNALGESASADIAGRMAAPLCQRIANTVGVGAGVLVGTLTPPPFELGGALVGGLIGREATKIGCNLAAHALGRTVWRDHHDKMNAILEDKSVPPSASAQAIAENKEFLQTFKVDDCKLDNITHVKLNAILHEQKKYNQELKKLDNKQNQEVALARFRGMEAGFNFVGQLGAMTNNKTLAAIGSVGAAGTSIAFNAAMITGSIPGVALSGWGLAVPYVGIAMAGLSIATALLGKKKNKESAEMQALMALSRQLHEVSVAIQERIIHLEGKIRELFLDLDNKITTHLSLLQVITADGFAMVEYRLDHIQNDIKHLTDIVKSGLTANYLQEFDGCVSAIQQYVKVKSERNRELEGKLITLTAWLSNAAYLKNTHDLSFPEFPACDLPNIALLNKGVETYVLGRMRLAAAAKVMDPDNNSINQIQSVADNGIRYLTEMRSQEKTLLLELLAQYETTYQSLSQAIVAGARTRLLTGTVPYFEHHQHDILNANHTWPALVSGCAFASVLAVLNANPKLTMPRLVQKALSMGIGTITAHFTGQTTPANRVCNDSYGDWHADHWINSRSASYQIKVCYELGGNQHTLYSISGSLPSQKVSHTGVFRAKGGGRHHEIGHEYNQIVAQANAISDATFLCNNWGSVILSAATANLVDMCDALKSIIIDAIVERTINANNQDCVNERLIIANEILKHPELLQNIPQQIEQLKNKIMRVQQLTCAPIELPLINAIWGETEIKQLLSMHKVLMMVPVQAVKEAIHNITDQSIRLPNVLLMQLQYCRHLLEVVKQYESLQCVTNIAELSDVLQVSEDIVVSADRIQCEMNKDNELGAGGFGKVYRAIDRETGQMMAVKSLFPGAKLLDAARGELQVLGRLQQDIQHSPYLVKMFGVTRLNERDCIVMEYIANHTLDYHLYESQNPLSIIQRNNVAKGIVHGLAYLHARNIIHGDIKSANVLMTENFEAKIADYGLAQVAVNTQSTSTVLPSCNNQVGTLYYMPPEFFKVNASGQPTLKSDMYALGVLIWQLLTNSKPFADINGNFAMIMKYWGCVLNNLPVTDHFAMPEIPNQQPDAVAFFGLFKPVVTECRAIESDNRPTAAILQTRMEL